MKLSTWAKLQGVCYRTAWRMWKANTLPVPAYQLPTGTIVLAEPKELGVALYARVSSHDQKADLDRQLERLSSYAKENNLKVVDSVKEIGSGLNGKRKGLLRLLSTTQASIILVEHRDRLTRFGFDYVEAALKSNNRKILVIDDNEVADDVVRDLHEIIVSLCSRLYGKRSADRKAKQALKVIQEEAVEDAV